MGSKNKSFGNSRSSSGGEIRIDVEGRPANVNLKKWVRETEWVEKSGHETELVV